MSDVDPTPETPVTIGDRMGWWRGDLAARLDALRGTPAADLAQLLSAVELLAGVEPATLRDLVAAITALRGAEPNNSIASLYTPINTHLPIIRENTGDTASNTSGILVELLELNSRVDNMQAALGAEPYNTLETANVRGLLHSILNALSSQTIGTAPISAPGDLPNNGDVVSDGRRYAIFLPPISGVAIAANGYDLTPSGSWLGWNAYIQTTDPAPRINTATDIANQWLALAGAGSINFNVLQQYPIKVFLRPPATNGFTWFWDLGEIQQLSTGAGIRWLPITNKYSELTFFNLNANAPRCLSTTTNFGGWRWEISSPGPSSVYGTNALSVVLSNPSGTVPTGTTNRWVVQTTAQPTAGTYIRIIPPQPS